MLIDWVILKMSSPVCDDEGVLSHAQAHETREVRAAAAAGGTGAAGSVLALPVNITFMLATFLYFKI